jgi:hypothetical protein
MTTCGEVIDELLEIETSIDLDAGRRKMTLFFVTVAIGLHPPNVSLYDVVRRWCHGT